MSRPSSDIFCDGGSREKDLERVALSDEGFTICDGWRRTTNVRADETQNPNAPTIARKSVQNILSFTW